jgi:O-antigen/teichoic acid export membrane protein
MVRLETVILFPALVLLTILAPVLIPWAFGARWSAAVVPTQILSLGGAATLVIDAAGVALMATGRGRAIMGYGWSHFLCYGAAVWILTPLGISAIAIGAAVVHGAFVLVAYTMLLHGQRDGRLAQLSAACHELLNDVVPATVSCMALAGVAVPLAMALSAVHIPVLPYLAAVSVAGGAAYLLALRVRYHESFGMLLSVVQHVLPGTRRFPHIARLKAAKLDPVAPAEN